MKMLLFLTWLMHIALIWKKAFVEWHLFVAIAIASKFFLNSYDSMENNSKGLQFGKIHKRRNT